MARLTPCWRLRSVWASWFWLLSCSLVTGDIRAGEIAREPDPTKLTQAVKKVLPAGWKVTRTQANVTPEDWETFMPRAGFLVEGSNGKDTFRIWFVPRDWVGIRKLPSKPRGPFYREGILLGTYCKTITAASDGTFCARARHLFAPNSRSTPSLCNGGYYEAMKIFRGKFDQADRTARELIQRHCKTPEQFAEAAHSLVVLGVPARTVFLRAAREVQGMDRDLFCSVLGSMGGKDAIGVLCELVTDARLEDQRRKYAAMALRHHTDRRIGPALHTALKQLREEDPLSTVVRTLVRVGHTVAAPDMLTAFRRIENSYYKAEVAQALAAFRHRPAIPDIRRFVESFRSNNQKPPAAAELALLLLTGDWGTPGASYRLHISAPAEAVLGQKLMLRIHVENIGKEPLWTWHVSETDLVVDGKKPPVELELTLGGGLMGHFYPGEVHTMTCDFSRRIVKPG
jgi:hypothetical protein